MEEAEGDENEDVLHLDSIGSILLNGTSVPQIQRRLDPLDPEQKI